MRRFFAFWWQCARTAFWGNAPFANDWQWLVGYPITAAALWGLGYFYAELSGRIEVTLTSGALGVLVAALVAYIITWFASFFVRLLNAPVVLFHEKKRNYQLTGLSPYLSRAEISPGSVRFGEKPEYRAYPFRDGNSATIYLEHQHLMANHEWTLPSSILLQEIGKFHAGEWSIIKATLLTTYKRDGKTVWRWGAQQEPPTDNAYIFMPNTWHRCRVIFIGPEGLVEDCFFKIQPLEETASDMPHVIGESFFDFADDWRERSLSYKKTH